MNKNKAMRKTKLIIALLMLAGCSSDPVTDSAPETVPIDVHAVPDAVPRHEKRTRAGNPGTYEVLGKQYTVLADSVGYRETGMASWYGVKFHGRNTSNGEVYDMYAMTAAHKTLPIPSYVRVTNLDNQRSVVVRINDRGPFHEGRIIDLSYTAAVKLGIQQKGTGRVEVVALEAGTESASSSTDEQLYLQIGAFLNQNNARQLQQRLLILADARSRLKEHRANNKTIYKVQIGPLSTTEKADEISHRLNALGLGGSHMVVDD